MKRSNMSHDTMQRAENATHGMLNSMQELARKAHMEREWVYEKVCELIDDIESEIECSQEMAARMISNAIKEWG